MKVRGYVLIVFVYLLLLQGCEKDKKEKNHPPLANLYASVTTGNSPLLVQFNANLSTDEDGDMLTYLWDFGDGNTSTSINPSKTFNAAGSYIVTLIVTDEEGLTDDASVTITVNEPPKLFPVSENAQWVYRVKSTNTENGAVSDYEEGITYLVVTDINRECTSIDCFSMRVTGKQYYNKSLLGDYLYLVHNPGSYLQITHKLGGTYKYLIDLTKTSWSDYEMFFSTGLDANVTVSTTNVTIGLGSFQAYRLRAQTDNWGENYVTERYDVTEEEYLDPQIGLLYRSKTRYTAFLDCFTCPVYGGDDKIELIGYYIPQEGSTPLQGGTGYNPNNSYGGNLGLLTIWASVDIGYTGIYLDGEYVGQIQNYWSSGLNCDQNGALNVFHPAGNYTLTAESPKGYIWEGTVTFAEGVCDKVELEIAKKSTSIGYHLNAIQP
jgi:PKD repeat protein